MARGDFKTIIAPKPTVSKIEQYRIERELPSNSQALVDIVAEFEGTSKLVKVLNTILVEIKQKIQNLKTESATKYKKTIETLIELVTTVIEAITLAQKKN
ncbi:hypothetical protein [Nitrosopumilus sp.]|uniref:hypothetical protein n=1 Tax=Nitrosopumilus sp. TaxID=2024843 RepID=UPI003D0FE9F7